MRRIFPAVIRPIAAFATMMGVLLMSMPGGACFFWSGIGVDHHHHGDHHEPDQPAPACFHDHGDCADHDHEHGPDPEIPERPCAPEAEGIEVLARVTGLKIDPVALPQVADFRPAWVLTPLGHGVSVRGLAPRSAVIGSEAPPPPAAVRYCRFLL